jgi:hypothetical protein
MATPAQQFIRDTVGFVPTGPEQLAILDSLKRFILVTGGEQAGKSYVAAEYMTEHVYEAEPGRYWLVGATYDDTEREWEYLTENFTDLRQLKTVTKRTDPGKMVLHDGTIIETKSAKDPRKLSKVAPKGILACEASQLDLQTYNRMRGRAAPAKGWVFMSGTLEASIGWYPALKKQWANGIGDRQSYPLPSWTNRFLYPGGRTDPEILALEADSSDEFFLERIAGEPVPPAGLVFPTFMPDVHIGSVHFIKELPVYVWSDPGYAGAYAVNCIQIVDGQVRMFDEIYTQKLITTEVTDILKNKPYYKNVDSRGVIDIAARQHQAMEAPVEVWLKETGIFMVSNSVRINDGTERLKSFLKIDQITSQPKLVIDASCTGILSEFGMAPNPFDQQVHAYRWGTDNNGAIVGKTPKDEYNHGIKAMIYGLVDRFGYSKVGNRTKIPVTRRR